MACKLVSVGVCDRKGHVTTHDDHLASCVLQQALVVETHLTGLRRLLERLLTTLGNATNVECPHGQLCARFADGLCRDDADGLANVDACTAGQVTTIAHRTNAIL